MRGYVYDIASLMLISLSIYFFYRSIAFLTTGDYVSGVVATVIGFFVIRVGVELSRVALVASAQNGESPRTPPP